MKPEPNPKWVALSEVLNEIQRDKKKEDNENPEKVLVLVHDRQTCYQLKKFLTMGANEYLLDEAFKKLQHDNLHKSKYVIENNFCIDITYRNFMFILYTYYNKFFK